MRKTNYPRLNCQVVSTDTTIAVPDSFAATLRPGATIGIDPDTWSAEVVRVVTVTRFLGRDEALVTVVRGISPSRARGHAIGAEIRRLT